MPSDERVWTHDRQQLAPRDDRDSRPRRSATRRSGAAVGPCARRSTRAAFAGTRPLVVHGTENIHRISRNRSVKIASAVRITCGDDTVVTSRVRLLSRVFNFCGVQLARALWEREQRRTYLGSELVRLERAEQFGAFDVRRIERELRKRLADWRELLRRQTPVARQIVSHLLDGTSPVHPEPGRTALHADRPREVRPAAKRGSSYSRYGTGTGIRTPV